MPFSELEITDKEQQVLDRIDQIHRDLSYATTSSIGWNGLLQRNTFANAVRGSNKLEGYTLSLEDAIAAVDGTEPVEAESRTWMATSGYCRAMTYVFQLARDPHFFYSEWLIRSLHFMSLSYDLTTHPGSWRRGPINIRDYQKHEIVHEGPPAEQVPILMRELIRALNASDHDRHPIIKAALGHLHLAMTHPFSDENGRMARCLHTLILARAGHLPPCFSSIEEYLGEHTLSYYALLADVGRGEWNQQHKVSRWIRFCLTAHFHQANMLLRRTKEIQRLWTELEILIQGRRLPKRVILALADAAMDVRVRNSTYRLAANIGQPAVASRDLKGLVEQGWLLSKGELRGRFYIATPRLTAIRARTRESQTETDPLF